VNEYLAELLRVVQLFGGDVVKFAGDAILIVWEGDSEESLELNVLCAAQCVVQMQDVAGDYPVEGTDLSFHIHCGLCCGALDTEVFAAPVSTQMQRFYHVVSGDPINDIGELVDHAKAGQTCVSWGCYEFLKDCAHFQDDGEYGKFLVELNLTEEVDEKVDKHIQLLRKDRERIRVPALCEDFIHPSVLAQLAHGGSQIAQMRNLCVFFIAKTSSGNSANWLMEVHDVLDRNRCPIVQIIDDDKGVHLTAAINLYESVPEATSLALKSCHELLSKQVGCAIGIAMGASFCGVTGSAEIACRWDMTGAPVVRAARLMQYALKEEIPIAIDQSVYDNASMPSSMSAFSCIFLKGSREPATVYILAPSRSVAASMILESYAFAPIHEKQVSLLTAFMSSGQTRGAAIVTGPVLTGKKVVCQRAAGLAQLTPILHVGDPTAGLFQIGRTLSEWFMHYNYEQRCCNGAEVVREHLANQRWNRAHDDCIKLINAVVQHGYRGCVLVDRVHDLDQFSLSFIRECLTVKKATRRSSTMSYSSRRSSSSVGDDEEKPTEIGRFFFLCTHVPLYEAMTAARIVQELVRAHTIHVPIIEVAEATKEELKIFVQKSVDLGVEDYWLDTYAKTSGCRPGYLFQRIRRLRIISANRVKEGMVPLTAITDEVKLHIPDRMARFVKAVPVTQVDVDTYMRFSREFDELPPSFQTFLEVITVATWRCFYAVPLKVAIGAMEDLFLENEAEDVFEVGLSTIVDELVSMYILKLEGEGEQKKVRLTCPAIGDVVSAVCTPVQVEAISFALLQRLESCDETKGFIDHLVMAGLAHRVNDLAKQQEHWKLAYAEFIEESKAMDEEVINRNKELFEEEIEVGGGEVERCLGVDLNIKREEYRTLNPRAAQLKYYSGPVTFGPMGHTLSVISRNCFKETLACHGASEEEIALIRQDIRNGVKRYIEQVQLVENYLSFHGFAASSGEIEKEVNLLKCLTKDANTDEEYLVKVHLFLDDLVPNYVETRMERLRSFVHSLQEKRIVPDVVKAADSAIRLAYEAIHRNGRRSEAVQEALVTLASFNWAPKKVPECLPQFFYQTVALVRTRIMRKLSDGELILFRHQHGFDDLDAYLILSALIPESDWPRVR
jgi:class 3 adenylate cyclase